MNNDLNKQELKIKRLNDELDYLKFIRSNAEFRASRCKMLLGRKSAQKLSTDKYIRLNTRLNTARSIIDSADEKIEMIESKIERLTSQREDDK